MLQYHEKILKIYEDDKTIEKAVSERAKQLRDNENDTRMDDLTVDAPSGAFDGCAVNHLQAAMQDVCDAHQRTLQENNQQDIDLLYIQLNVDQKRIVDHVINAVCSNNEDPMRLFVSGTAGTGKSELYMFYIS